MDDHDALIRQVRQRLESLRRDGLDRIPAPPVGPRASRPEPPTVAPPPRRPEPAPVPRAAPEPPPAAAPPPLPRAASLFDEPTIDAEPRVPAEDRPAMLAELAATIAGCTLCAELASTRTQTVFGEGSPTARLMFVGEAPGETEDKTGRPFVGRAGELLTDMITKGMGLRREDVYIANILKSRPPANRDPMPAEVRNCLPYLDRQIAIIRPAFLCILGKPAAHALLETALPVGRLRGRWHTVRGIPAIVSWHPAYLLRNPAAKREAWDDLQLLMRAMGIAPPGRPRA